MAEQMMQETAGKAIPAGYQQTELGVIPEDWSVSPMSSLTCLMTNGFVGTAKTHYTEAHNGVTYIQGYNVEENGFNFHGIKKVTEEFHRKNSKSCLKAGDLLMVQTGDVGLVTVVPPCLEGSNCHALIINRFKPEYDSAFFSYLFNSQQGRMRLKELETGTTMKHINVGDLLNFVVPFPSKKQEQTAIANVLSDSDALIDALAQLIAKKQAIKSATMQQLLTGRTRLPAFALRPDGTPKGYKPSELGDIPEDWEVLSLGSFGRTIRGVSYNPNHDLFLYDSSESIRLFRSNNIFESKIEKSELQYVSKSRVADHQVIMVGDILICMANGSKSLVGKSAFYSIDDGYKYTFGAFMGVYRASDNVNRQYVHYLMNTEWYRRYIDLVLAGSSINNLKPSHVDQISFAFPDIKEQTAIATILSDMDNELQVLTQKLEKARALKQGMMQQLLTGKIRLPLAAGA
ncbi:restriction endonuclease subunit S [Aeromonas sp. Y318-1]|uniref:restriction endonuclease subunit S n=1 Tax=Aeromonas sp. Y318-1 TaxID=2990508 RepID=UPI0022DF7B58|nr:restriction endonuclease subunit S [Aeromonas sp. Y318-1]